MSGTTSGAMKAWRKRLANSRGQTVKRLIKQRISPSVRNGAKASKLARVDRETAAMSPGKKAQQTAKWARTMTRWLITRASKLGAKWQVVGFEGPNGSESYGIVDLLAVRKDHQKGSNGKRGDLFELVLIQAKGGASPMPTEGDKERLNAVRRFYRARAAVLCKWQRGRVLSFQRLVGQDWEPVTALEVFGTRSKNPSSSVQAVPR